MRRVALFLTFLLVSASAPAEPLKLDADTAAQRIETVSHARAAAASRLEAAEAAVRATKAGALPSLAAQASAAKRSSVPEFRLPIAVPGQEAPVLFPDITETYGASLRAQQLIYAGGAIRGQRDGALHDREASRSAMSQVAADLRLTARLAYWDAVRARATLKAAEAQEARAKRLLGDTRAFLEAGMAVRADLLAAEERVASARVLVLRAETDAANTMATLRSLLAVAEEAVELKDTLETAVPVPAAPLETLLREALLRRPELKIAEEQLAALKAREALARAPGKPSLSAALQYDVGRPNARYFPQAEEWNGSWSVGLAASWTLFDGGRSRAEAAASRALQRALEEESLELLRRIRLEVEVSRREQANAAASVASADAARAAAVERERAATERREAGVAPISELLDAQAALAAAEQEQVRSRAAAWGAAARLLRAVGS